MHRLTFKFHLPDDRNSFHADVIAIERTFLPELHIVGGTIKGSKMEDECTATMLTMMNSLGWQRGAFPCNQLARIVTIAAEYDGYMREHRYFASWSELRDVDPEGVAFAERILLASIRPV